MGFTALRRQAPHLHECRDRPDHTVTAHVRIPSGIHEHDSESATFRHRIRDDPGKHIPVTTRFTGKHQTNIIEMLPDIEPLVIDCVSENLRQTVNDQANRLTPHMIIECDNGIP